MMVLGSQKWKKAPKFLKKDLFQYLEMEHRLFSPMLLEFFFLEISIGPLMIFRSRVHL